MKKTILLALTALAAGSALSACVEYRGGPPPRVIAGDWIPGHYDRGGFWIPGHYR